MSEAICYLNGEFLPLNQAKISVLDRGFIFGDGVYEVIPAYAGKLLRLDHHLERLQDSLDGIRLTNPLAVDEWKTILNQLVEKNHHPEVSEDQSVYLQVTRGVAKRDHGFPPESTPTVFMMSNPLLPMNYSVRQQGVHAITLDDIRWQYCNIKSIALLPNILLRQQALEADSAEAILVRNGQVTEGAASNVFIIKDNTLVTPPKGPKLLPGITRDLIVELAHSNGIPCEERDISEDELYNADEIWLTSSTKEILPVTHLNQKPVGQAEPGDLWQKMDAIYQQYKAQLKAGKYE